MTRYIDADVYKNHLEFYQWTLKKFYPNCRGLIARVLSLVDDMETVDAVPVLRCKNCGHFKNEDENDVDEYGNFYSTCIYMPEASDTDFCSKAEMKENE